MKTTLVITFTGEDRPGLVDRLAAVVRRHGGNWERSRMARMAGRFAGILEVTAPPDGADALADALVEAGRDASLAVLVDRGAESERPPTRLRALELAGHDREGIVSELSGALARRGLNIEALETACAEAPMAGGMLFTARAELRAPVEVSFDEVAQIVSDLADQLMVEITVEPRGDG